MLRSEAIAYRRKIENAAAHLGDQEAAASPELFPDWKQLEGVWVERGRRIRCEGRLYRAVQAHRVQSQFAPGPGTEALYERLDDAHSGTADDPVPYEGNMTLEQGNYYIQQGTLYRCVRGSGIPIHETLEFLASEAGGRYVEKVQA